MSLGNVTKGLALGKRGLPWMEKEQEEKWLKEPKTQGKMRIACVNGYDIDHICWPGVNKLISLEA